MSDIEEVDKVWKVYIEPTSIKDVKTTKTKEQLRQELEDRIRSFCEAEQHRNVFGL